MEILQRNLQKVIFQIILMSCVLVFHASHSAFLVSKKDLQTRGTLFFDVCQILERKHPSVVFLENVKHLQYHDGGRTLEVILKKLKELGYHTEWKILNAADFGVPQNRERIIIIGSLKQPFDFSRLVKHPRKPLIDILDESGDFEYLDPSEYTLLKETHQTQAGLIFAG